MHNSIDLYVFSGTGNTLLAVEKMTEVFRAKGCDVNVNLIEKSKPEEIDITRVLGLAFPVAAQSTYPFIWEFIYKIPEGNGQEVFMLDTLGGVSGGIVGPLREILRKKGYNPIGACEIIMPNNFLRSTEKGPKDQEILEKGILKAADYANELIEGRAVWGRFPVFSDILSYLSRYLYNRFPVIRRWFSPVIEGEKCTRCGRCAKICPVSAITLSDHKYSIDANKCEACMRCFAFCPSDAIRVRKCLAYRAVEYGDFYRNFQ